MKLYDIDSEYTLLMFANPDCPMCRAIIDDIESSVILTEFVEMERLTVVAIYTDSDIAAWKRYLPSLPKSWIKGYDNQSISHDKLYNLRAIPALYLLDNKKLVLIKDGTSIEHIEYIISL
jgi:thiol-disulfide isomerase/thioredoxin